MRDMGPILAELERLRIECNHYRQEAMQERELSAEIVGERDQLIIENEQLREQRNKAVESAARYSRIANELSQGE